MLPVFGVTIHQPEHHEGGIGRGFLGGNGGSFLAVGVNLFVDFLMDVSADGGLVECCDHVLCRSAAPANKALFQLRHRRELFFQGAEPHAQERCDFFVFTTALPQPLNHVPHGITIFPSQLSGLGVVNHNFVVGAHFGLAFSVQVSGVH